MENHDNHITSYQENAIILVLLLVLTFVTVFVAELDFGAWSVGVALIVASIKAFTVLANFMHVKHESLFVKLMIAGVFLLFAIVIVITFIDYLLR